MQSNKMRIEPILATWAADWKLLGPPVWLSLGLGIIGASSVSRLSPFSPSAQQRLIRLLPVVILLDCLFLIWLKGADLHLFGTWYFYKCYYAHLDTAFIISFAFGSAFVLDLIRLKEHQYKIVRWSIIALYAILLVWALIYIYNWYLF